MASLPLATLPFPDIAAENRMLARPARPESIQTTVFLSFSLEGREGKKVGKGPGPWGLSAPYLSSTGSGRERG